MPSPTFFRRPISSTIARRNATWRIAWCFASSLSAWYRVARSTETRSTRFRIGSGWDAAEVGRSGDPAERAAIAIATSGDSWKRGWEIS
jgi:hypothetical protein